MGDFNAGIGQKAYLEEPVTLLEEEVVIDELLLGFLGHAGEGVVSSLQFVGEAGQGRGHLVFHLFVLGLGQAWVEGVSFHRPSAPDSCGDDELTLCVNRCLLEIL